MSVLFSPTAMVVPFENLRMSDVEAVGGKNASLGEMISQLPQGVNVPTGFATTAHAFRLFLQQDGLDERIETSLKKLDSENVVDLAATGAEIRAWIIAQNFPFELEQEVKKLSPFWIKVQSVLPTQSDLQPPQKICLMLPLPVSRKVFSMCKALTMYC